VIYAGSYLLPSMGVANLKLGSKEFQKNVKMIGDAPDTLREGKRDKLLRDARR
jgi:hypothetical protein